MARNRIFIFGCLGAIVLAVALVAIIYVTLRAPFDMARSRWDEKGSDSYTMVVTQYCFCAITGEYLITVQAGTVISAENTDPNAPPPPLQSPYYLTHFQPMTVSGMLTIAEVSMSNAWTAPLFHEFTVKYDPTYGYVTDYSSDANGDLDRLIGRIVTDAGYSYTARDLVIANP